MACSKYSYRELEQCISKVERLIDTLNEFTGDLDKHKFNGNVSKAVGGAVGVVGSGLVIGGFIAAFFTFGVAAILIPVGAAIGAAGGGTVAGTAIAEIVIKKTKLQEAQKLWEGILEDPVMQQYLEEIDDPGNEGGGFDFAAGAARGIKAGLQIGLTAGKTVLLTAKISVRSLAVAGVVVEAILLPLSLYDLINSSIEAHKRSKCPAGEALRTVAQMFAEVRDRLQELLDQPATYFNARPLNKS